ncbi:hypothetical protein PJI17_24725 [Mycobacterium kansasii]
MVTDLWCASARAADSPGSCSLVAAPSCARGSCGRETGDDILWSPPAPISAWLEDVGGSASGAGGRTICLRAENFSGSIRRTPTTRPAS